VLSAEGVLDIRIMFVVAVGCAIAGDSVGYEVGKHLGPRLEVSWIGRRVGQRRWDTAQLFLDTHGGKSVFLGRSVALLRALVPGLAGMSGMKYRRFLGWNALGGLVWGGGCVLLGYFFARSIRRVEQYLSYGGFVLFTLVVLGFVGWHFYKRRRDAQVSP
jgi:membrane protein DedA with SNARE-associated domain